MFENILKTFHCGDVGLTVSITGDGVRQTPVTTSCETTDSLVHYTAVYRDFQDDLWLEISGTELKARRTLKNISDSPQKLTELTAEFNGISFGAASRDDFFYHNENPRVYEIMTFPIDYNRSAEDATESAFDFVAGNRWADPDVAGPLIGASLYQPFPAILLSNYQTRHGLVHGTLSQRYCYHCYLVGHKNDTVTLMAFSRFKDIDALDMAPGRVIIDEWYLGTTESADDLDHIFDGYTAALRKVLPPMFGSTDVNRHSMIWGSWNDGIFRNITEDMILEEARHLKANFPMVEWIQVDDGYAVHTPPAHGLGMPYEGEAGVDHAKFPHGLRHFTDEIRKIGLKPAIWIGGFCPKHAPLYKEHPEWFMDYDYRVKTSAPLDISLPEVRDYMTSALDTLLLDYGFDGVKQDFWSYAFEDSHNLFQGPHDHSGYEYRDWWLREFRKRLPAYAHFQSGCDIAMGNPFLGEFYTNYRYGIDIGSGNWDYVKTNFLWGVACFATHANDLIVPNSDSVGLFPGLNDTEAMFCLNYCLVTHSMVEIAGRLSQNQTSPRLAALRKTVCCPNNGADVFLARYDYRDHAHQIPEILYFHTPFFALQAQGNAAPLCTVGLFNIEEQQKDIAMAPTDFKLPVGHYIATDVWSGQTFPFDGETPFPVVAHGSRLLAINHAVGQQLLDANIGASTLTAETTPAQTVVTLAARYAQPQAEMLFLRNPSNATLTLDDTPLAFTVTDNKLLFALPKAGKLMVRF